MIFDPALEPVTLWQYAERFLGVGTRSYSTFSGDLDISAEFHPQLGARTVTIPTMVVPSWAGEYLTSIDSKLHAHYRLDDEFLLPVHPDAMTVDDLRDRDTLARCRPGPTIEAVPSANARTVFVERIGGLPVEPHFLKLHYPRRLSRFTRRLRRPVIDLELWASAELIRIGAPFLPEVGGAWIGHDPEHAWGFILRESRPAGDLSTRFTVPLFALYGRDLRAVDDPTLLEQLIAVTGERPEEFIGHRIVEPMVRLWTNVVRRSGCVPETHAQNTLFGFTEDGAGSEILYRDCAVYVDPALRARTTDLPPVNVIGRDIRQPAGLVFSLTYDSFMGHHALSYVARLASDRYGVRPEALHGIARAEFLRRGGDQLPMPRTIHYYDDRIHDDGKWNLVDTGQRPLWR